MHSIENINIFYDVVSEDFFLNVVNGIDDDLTKLISKVSLQSSNDFLHLLLQPLLSKCKSNAMPPLPSSEPPIRCFKFRMTTFFCKLLCFLIKNRTVDRRVPQFYKQKSINKEFLRLVYLFHFCAESKNRDHQQLRS